MCQPVIWKEGLALILLLNAQAIRKKPTANLILVVDGDIVRRQVENAKLVIIDDFILTTFLIDVEELIQSHTEAGIGALNRKFLYISYICFLDQN